MQKLSIKQIGTIVKLRGLGFSQKEIAEQIGNITPATISYQLSRINKLALKDGIDEVFEFYVYCAKKKSP